PSVTALPTASTVVASTALPLASAIPALGPYTGGDLTFYTPGEMNATACGQKHADSDPIAALPKAFFDGYPGATPANPNISPLCGRQIIITAATPEGPLVNVTATVADICGDCNITTSVDVTPVLFTQVAPQSVGRVHGISWDW
ncbi:barwin-like endoglucanase, partial [Mycena leptocephala]